MKARVKATGEIVEVQRLCMSSKGDIYQIGTGQEYLFDDDLDFNLKENNEGSVVYIDPTTDYWTRLEHQYAGMAMQGILTNPIGFENIKARGTNIQIETALLASEFAHALVENYKKEERK